MGRVTEGAGFMEVFRRVCGSVEEGVCRIYAGCEEVVRRA